MQVARLRPAPYAEYWSKLPARHLPILSPSAYAALAPLLPSNSLHAPGWAMLEMLGHSSNQFSAGHTGPGCLRGPPAHPESISLRDCGSSLPFPLPAPHPEGWCKRRWVPLTTHHHKLDHRSRHTCSWRKRVSIKDRNSFH